MIDSTVTNIILIRGIFPLRDVASRNQIELGRNFLRHEYCPRLKKSHCEEIDHQVR